MPGVGHFRNLWLVSEKVNLSSLAIYDYLEREKRHKEKDEDSFFPGNLFRYGDSKLRQRGAHLNS
jgi:hypothetical protein